MVEMGTAHRFQRPLIDRALVGVLETPVAFPGHPLCHLARIDSDTRHEIESEIERGEFDGYRLLGLRWMGDGDETAWRTVASRHNHLEGR